MTARVNDGVNEAELVRKAAEGSREAFEHLAVSIRPMLFRAARRLTGNPADAEELVQDCLTSALRGIRTLKEPAAWRVWMFQILHRRNYDRLSRASRAPTAAELPSAPDPLAQLLRAETLEAARRALESLEDPLRTVLTLRYLGQMDLKSIAARTKLPLGTVKYHAHAGLRAFAQAFREMLP